MLANPILACLGAGLYLAVGVGLLHKMRGVLERNPHLRAASGPITFCTLFLWPLMLLWGLWQMLVGWVSGKANADAR